MVKEYDLLIIGGGPGGYVAAIRGAQLGFKVALIEEDKVGGVCLHKGCIPSKAFIKSAEVFNLIKAAEKFGVSCSNQSFDFAAIKKRAQSIINTLHNGVKDLLAKNKVDVYNFKASLMGASIFSPLCGSVAVPLLTGETDIIVSKNIIIATGTIVNSLAGLDIDGDYVISSNEALELEDVPKSIVIIGGGVIGIEWAALLSGLGCKVTVLEHAANILPLEDLEISTELKKQLTKKGINIINNANVLPQTLVKTAANVSINAKIDNQETTFTADKIMVAVGRTPNTKNIGLENTKVTLDNKGYIEVDNNFRTKERHIFAIGDVTGFMPLAHAASAAGVYVVEFLKGLKPPKLFKDNIPRCVYTKPEVAAIGLSEEEAKDKGIDIKVAKFPFMANAKALIEEERGGFIKVIVDKNTNDLLGVHIIGAKATELIATGALAKFLDASGLELGKAVYPHPSLSEIIAEGALGVYHAAIHKH